MGELKYAILGLINQNPLTGYDIMKEFSESTRSNFWRAKHSQIYPELQKLVQEKSLEYEIIIQGEKLEKKLYHITKSGLADLIQWLSKDEVVTEVPKDTFRLRSYFSNLLPQPQFKMLLESQLTAHQVKYALLIEIMDTKHKVIPTFGTEEFGDYIILDGALIQEKGHIDWLTNCLKLLSHDS